MCTSNQVLHIATSPPEGMVSLDRFNLHRLLISILTFRFIIELGPLTTFLCYSPFFLLFCLRDDVVSVISIFCALPTFDVWHLDILAFVLSVLSAVSWLSWGVESAARGLVAFDSSDQESTESPNRWIDSWSSPISYRTANLVVVLVLLSTLMLMWCYCYSLQVGIQGMQRSHVFVGRTTGTSARSPAHSNER